MYFRCAVIVLGATLPHPKVRCSIGPFNVVNQILHKRHFVLSVNDLESGCDHLNQKYYAKIMFSRIKNISSKFHSSKSHILNGYSVDLQMIIQIVRVNFLNRKRNEIVELDTGNKLKKFYLVQPLRCANEICNVTHVDWIDAV